MLPLILASVVCLAPGTTIQTDIDVGFAPLYTGVLSSENPFVADVSGRVAPRSRMGTMTVDGVREGEAGVTLTFVSGISVYRLRVGTVIVGAPLTVTLTTPAGPVAEGTPLTLSAITGGDQPVQVAWYEGSGYLGLGDSITLELPRGTHRIRAEAWNRCGTVTGEIDLVVAARRRRAASH
jgi:hypothetical protein